MTTEREKELLLWALVDMLGGEITVELPDDVPSRVVRRIVGSLGDVTLRAELGLVVERDD